MDANSTKIKPEAFPPTKRSAHFHSLHVYLQLHERNNLNSEVLKTEYWSWKLENNRFVPIMTDELPATSDILSVIRCNCKIWSKNPCGLNSTCSCHAKGLKCVASCGDCRGTECMNISAIVSNDDAGHEEFDCDDENMFECIFELWWLSIFKTSQ